MEKIKIGIIKEGKTPPDKRVPLTPAQCKQVMEMYPQVDLTVQRSNIRIFPDEDYEKHGVKVVDDLLDRDIIMGVKEVPISMLIPNKTFMFFSHTIKEQPYNRNLLRAILDKKIRLIDWETIVDENGNRVIGFGRYAGIVGAYNTLRAYGKRTGSFEIKPAHQCADRAEMEQEYKKIVLPPVKILVTGKGRVAGGVIEVLEGIGIQRVSPEDYIAKSFDKPVYTQIHVNKYVKRKSDGKVDVREFYQMPELYESDFMKWAKITDIYIAAHFWKEGSPYIFSREDAKKQDFKIQVVGDISCDIDGPVASTIRPSTIADPIYGYHPHKEQETHYLEKDTITVMAVDNLPCELPKDASKDFGEELIKNVLPYLIGKDDGRIKNATITENGKLTPKYSYLKNYVEGQQTSQV